MAFGSGQIFTVSLFSLKVASSMGYMITTLGQTFKQFYMWTLLKS